MSERHPYLDMDMEARAAYLRLSNRIATYRNMKGMTQHELAEELGVSWARLSGCECGTRSVTIQLAFAAAEYFGITVNNLLGLPSHEELLELKAPNINIAPGCELQVDEHYQEVPYAEKSKTYLFPCNNIKSLRTAAGLRMVAIGALVNRSISMVNGWEKRLHVPRLDLAVELAIFFGVTLNQLMGVPETAHPIQCQYNYLQNWAGVLPKDVMWWGAEVAKRLTQKRGAEDDSALDAPEMFAPFQLTKPEDLKVVCLMRRPWPDMKNKYELPKRLIGGLRNEYGLTEAPDSISSRLAKEGVMCLPMDFEQGLNASEQTSRAPRTANRFIGRFIRMCSELPAPIVFVCFGDIVYNAISQYINDSDGNNAIILQKDFRWAGPDQGLFHRINEVLIGMDGTPVKWSAD